VAQSKTILDDPRTPAQLTSDALLQLLLQGADAPTDFLLGSGAPVIKIAATRKAVKTRRGPAHIEGRAFAVSIETLERHLCNGTEETTNFDKNRIPLDMGHDQRLFTKRQKDVLAVKWGGCACPDCDRPPSWTESHHIKWVKRDGGRTDIADGILLCKYHHLLFHNYGWEIERNDLGQYWLIPPTSIDPAQKPILLEPKGGVMRDLEREQRERTGSRCL
ncbi:MAG TPA: HNH endonuclease signature motif containing protein, partial [Galbitalea sp.]|nr:HNH endonuclease signature motif containing protein [Galbitalea sp.]